MKTRRDDAPRMNSFRFRRKAIVGGKPGRSRLMSCPWPASSRPDASAVVRAGRLLLLVATLLPFAAPGFAVCGRSAAVRPPDLSFLGGALVPRLAPPLLLPRLSVHFSCVLRRGWRFSPPVSATEWTEFSERAFAPSRGSCCFTAAICALMRLRASTLSRDFSSRRRCSCASTPPPSPGPPPAPAPAPRASRAPCPSSWPTCGSGWAAACPRLWRVPRQRPDARRLGLVPLPGAPPPRPSASP